MAFKVTWQPGQSGGEAVRASPRFLSLTVSRAGPPDASSPGQFREGPTSQLTQFPWEPGAESQLQFSLPLGTLDSS